MILLASKSPRRQELLKQIGINFKVIDIDIDESSLPLEDPLHYVERMAKQKAMSVKEMLINVDLPILTADTIVTKNNLILGKPKDYDDFCSMMHILSDTTHQVFSSIALQSRGQIIVKTCISHVSFAHIPDHFISSYWATQEPQDKAGGYAIQGLMAQYIQKIEGSYSGIMGLPLFELSEALNEIEYNHALVITE